MLCSWARTLCLSSPPRVWGTRKLSGKLDKMLEGKGGGGNFHATETGMSFTSLLAQEHPLPCPIIKSIL